MPLFTFVVDYKGGTFISQQTGTSSWGAFCSWHSKLLPNETIIGVSMDVFHALSDSAQDDLVRLKGVHNVWCVSGSFEEELLLLNIIRTEV